MKKTILTVTIFLTSLTSLASADFYTWKDDDGQLHVTNKEPSGVSKEDVIVREYSQESHAQRQPSETFQRRVHQQLDAVNSHKYAKPNDGNEMKRAIEKRRFKKTVDVEEDMLKERIHYYQWDCQKNNNRKYCDSKQKMYEQKLKLLNRDPEEYFMRETRY
ncbi:DUF4124 domain-containing protein [Desulfuromonas acetoxidans]|uniref:DUF4124 domain-containing protein n=1 Tax=Desulfuromonas acetoxidans (strain DSM 684 / 11070) TaxID=281689 RepID=Q1K3N6_DESA6|nr:DUF4124 domain-containing protein [Desulfuromonas acetoxidans]EAT16938.1 hypothetical protein Dace_2804 [Desulfuromonas acetoxidans DSM 684]MBF0644533.1 DUF4124 domain-containing protein [Desulfuromonas acetoxidans]NVD23940.1 DUF4124 domain-containing protein [Desulfuromonas acetoxidans]NVE16237.1 DUF4124 domain-containing protein [Desulfuromonas acetoxidans]